MPSWIWQDMCRHKGMPMSYVSVYVSVFVLAAERWRKPVHHQQGLLSVEYVFVCLCSTQREKADVIAFRKGIYVIHLKFQRKKKTHTLPYSFIMLLKFGSNNSRNYIFWCVANKYNILQVLPTTTFHQAITSYNKNTELCTIPVEWSCVTNRTNFFLSSSMWMDFKAPIWWERKNLCFKNLAGLINCLIWLISK